MDFCPHKKTSQRLYQVPKCPKQQQYPNRTKNYFKFFDLSTCAGLGPTFYWYHVLTQIWRKNSQGRPNTDRQISKFMCFFCFFAGRMEEHVHVFYFCNGFSMCSDFFAEILIAKFRFRHSERRWMLVFWKKCPFHAVQEINRMVEELCEEVRGQQPGGVNKLAFTHQWDWDTWDGSEFMAWIVIDHVPGILSLWRLGCKKLSLNCWILRFWTCHCMTFVWVVLCILQAVELQKKQV